MTNRPPPVPPANRSPKGPGGDNEAPLDTASAKRDANRQRNLTEQGRQGNIKQNTSNQGYQQDR